MRRALAALLLISGLPAGACSFPEYQELEPVPVETCRDGLQNFGEIAVDCGPTCGAGCVMGQSCTSNEECKTGSCQQGQCGIASCTDGLRDQSETDVDCGGMNGCPPCATDKRCDSDYDCDMARCNAGFCLAQSCSDGVQNQDESDIDCGGKICDLCQTKQHCKSMADCDHLQCAQGLCQSQDCADGITNGDETDLDCGGSCVPCADSARCQKAEDCQSSSCVPGGNICVAATCSDGILNGTEPSLDCGSSCQNKKCENVQACASGQDCKSGTCSEERCVPATATGTALPSAGWILSASATFNSSAVPRKAADGDMTTHWTSGVGQVPGMWFQIDMLTPTPFFAVEILCTSNGDYARSIRMLLSDDGQTFTPATSTVAGETSLRFDFAMAKTARYIKLEVEQDTGGLWWRIDELHVLQ